MAFESVIPSRLEPGNRRDLRASQLGAPGNLAPAAASRDRSAIGSSSERRIGRKDRVRAFRGAATLGHPARGNRHCSRGRVVLTDPPAGRLRRSRQRRSTPVSRCGELHLLPLCIGGCRTHGDGLQLSRRRHRCRITAPECDDGRRQSQELRRASKVAHTLPPRSEFRR
jgi:hypothetical protein